MDIVFVTDHLLRGGADVQLARTAAALRRRGWRVAVLTMLPSAAHTELLEAAGVPCVACAQGMPLLPGLPFAMTLRMVGHLRRWRPSLVITFSYHGDIMGRVCARLAGVPAVVSTFRTAYVKTRMRERLYRATRRMVDLTAANSHAGVRYLVERGILDPGRTLVIPNGIQADQYPAPADPPGVRAELGLPESAFVWLAVGNLLPSKDYPTLLEAAARCAEAEPSFHLLIAGGGDRTGLEALLSDPEQAALRPRARLLGSRTDVPRLFRACDAYVLSSAWEGMPNTVMEAMASAVPVVCTEAGGVPELVGGAGCGFMVPCRDPGALAGRMLAMMALAPEVRAAMGRAGQQRIRAVYDQDRVMDHWETLARQEIRSAEGSGPHGPAPAGNRTDLPAAFVVSLDFELMWGVLDKHTIEEYGDAVAGERQAVPAMLDLFRRHRVKATWATVGMTLFERKRDLLDYLPERRPVYRDPVLDPYRALEHVGRDEASDPYHFGLSLVRRIQDCEGMEVGSHTFGHFYCLEPGQDAGDFQADLEAWAAAAGRLDIRPECLVFPRNQVNPDYLARCAGLGYRVFRGNEESWLYRSGSGKDEPILKRAMRLADHYVNLSGDHGFIPRPWLDTGLVNCPASRFLRPWSGRLAGLEPRRIARIKDAMTLAARRGQCYHLWWHPHNFGRNLRENLAVLEQLLVHHEALRERYGVVSMTMGEVGRAVRERMAG